MALAGITAAAIPAGWIALKHVPAQGEESGYWILVKEPADGLSAWWSDEELAKIIAGDEDYVQHLETDWSPEDHPVADAVEAELLTEELAQYWDGDVPQANFWAHGALTRRGSTLRAFRWEQDGLTQRGALERSGERPEIPAAAVDPDPVDQRYDNSEDIVTHGDRWAVIFGPGRSITSTPPSATRLSGGITPTRRLPVKLHRRPARRSRPAARRVFKPRWACSRTTSGAGAGSLRRA